MSTPSQGADHLTLPQGSMAPPADGSTRPLSTRVVARWDDCDRYGHLNNAAYVALAREAHDALGIQGARLAEFTISYRSPVPRGAIVEIRVRPQDGAPDDVATELEFAVAGRQMATARAVWTDAPGHPLPGPQGDEVDAPGRWFSFEERARTYHLGPDGQLRPQVLLQSLEYAVFRAAEVAGWPLRRMHEAGFVSLAVGHQLVLGCPVGQGERLWIASRLTSVRRVSAIWLHEVRRGDGSVVATDRARGVFLDLGGSIRPAPAGLIEDLLLGEEPAAHALEPGCPA